MSMPGTSTKRNSLSCTQYQSEPISIRRRKRRLAERCERLSPLTAMMRTRLDSISGVAVRMLTNINCTSLPSSATSAGAAPLYGTCVMSIFAVVFTISPPRCAPPPPPDEPKLSTPGFAFA